MTVTAATIESRFSSGIGKAEFATFCNSIIALEAPRLPSFPNLASKPGPDGGIDGQWDLTGLRLDSTCALTRPGWNIYQFKTVDIVSLGREKAFRELRSRSEGAIAELIQRLAVPATPALYVLFTNLQLGID